MIDLTGDDDDQVVGVPRNAVVAARVGAGAGAGAGKKAHPSPATASAKKKKNGKSDFSLSAYMDFCAQHRAELGRQHPTATDGELRKMLVAMWDALEDAHTAVEAQAALAGGAGAGAGAGAGSSSAARARARAAKGEVVVLE